MLTTAIPSSKTGARLIGVLICRALKPSSRAWIPKIFFATPRAFSHGARAVCECRSVA